MARQKLFLTPMSQQALGWGIDLGKEQAQRVASICFLPANDDNIHHGDNDQEVSSAFFTGQFSPMALGISYFVYWDTRD